MERGAADDFVTDFGPMLSLFFRDPDGLECEVCVENPDAVPGSSTGRERGLPGLLEPLGGCPPTPADPASSPLATPEGFSETINGSVLTF